MAVPVAVSAAVSVAIPAMAHLPHLEPADLERRFGGLRRLYGDRDYERLRAATVAVVGLGGVGSWTAEALARSGVAGLVLFDLDHITESNINRQVQASGATLGAHKGQALLERIADIHPGCDVRVVDAFVEPDNWPALLPVPVQALVDGCDQVRAKAALATWALLHRVPLVCVGAAGGKREAQRVEVADLADVTHDPLLASLRQRLRKEGGAPRTGAMGLRCVFSRESVLAPAKAGNAGSAGGGAAASGAGNPAEITAGGLNCHGYGSTVTVTATFGMVAAGEAIRQLLAAGAR